MGPGDVPELPHSDEAEGAVLGGILVDNSRLPAAQELLTESDFYREGHRAIFRAMRRLREAGSAIDLLTVTAALEATGELDRVGAVEGAGPGGAAYVSSLTDGVPRSSNVEHYARIVLSKARRRALIGPAQALLSAAYNGEPDDEVESARARLIEVPPLSASAGGYSLEPLRFSDHRPDLPPPIAFGDAAGDVSLVVGDLAVFAGDSGAGKSLAILDLAIAWCTAAPWLGFPCAVQAGRALIGTSDGDGADPVRARVVRLGQGRGLDTAALDDLPLRVVTADGFSLDVPACFAALKKELDTSDPDFVGLETLSSLMGPERDPFNQRDVADFVGRRLRPLQLRPDGTRRMLVASTHLRKRTAAPGANSLRDRVAGSFYVVAGADSVLGFEPAGEAGFTLRLVKVSRWGLRFRPFHVRIEGDPPGPLALHTTGPLEQTATEQGDDENRVLQTLSALQSLSPDGWIALANIKRRLGVNPKDKKAAGASKRIERAAIRLAAAGTIEAHKTRKGTYRLPPKGGSLEFEDEVDS